MLHELRLPDLGEGVTEGEVVDWLVSEGDRVEEDTPLVEVMTDKASVQIPSPVAGTVESLRVAAGQRVPVGTVLLGIRAAEGVPAGSARAEEGVGAAGGGEQRVRALPSTRRLARELGVDITAVAGSGHDGRVTSDDVRTAHAQRVIGRDAPANGAVAEPEPAPARTATAGRRIPLRGRRRAIAEHLARAAAVPTVTFVEEVELDRLDALRARLAEREGLRIAYLPFAVAACAQALRGMPMLNSSLDVEAQEIVVHDAVHVGVAVDTDDGLVVPVVRHADRLGVRAIAEAIDELVTAARAATLAPEQLRGSTFTVSSAGRWGGFVATPIVNAPEVAILGIHRAEQRPVVRDGAIVVRTIANVSLTFDHRVVDGVAAARFARTVVDSLEEPALLAVGPLR